MIQNGEFDAVVDVRQQAEWDNGHIEGAYFVKSLGSYVGASNMMMGSSMASSGSPNDLAGCEHCSIAVYCVSGRRAGLAIQVLKDNGFKGELYNGLGVTDW
eukprot:CAMPEP_0198137292 /NCGR_PEP_ID=MMETSP1443-20131203/811_1 /TAXON_ID=186043 /ORGANISM="Entomoneis sp., Strain CCMP2396" /LENGTH=100 /DNA_ID=CAMNT_0043798677 /DNA_START=320 /DNA_END=619 /DNA_ORIENTATION=-